MRQRKRLVYIALLCFSVFLLIGNRNQDNTKNISSARKNNRPGDVKDAYSSLESTTPQFTAVVILTYMRSGSSLAGDILQHSPGVFYVYEPLHFLERQVKRQPETPLIFVNGTMRPWPIDYSEEAVNIIRNWIACNITQLPETSLSDAFLGKGLRLRDYRRCYGRGLKESGNRSVSLNACVPKLKTACEQSNVRVIKTIRLSLKLISHLMKEIPGLKIVHLVRDPRATLRSQMSFGMCPMPKHGGTYNCTNKYCSRLESDSAEMEYLSKMYKGRVATVFYEDVAARPLETSKTLFEFVGTTFSHNAEGYVYNITSAGNDEKLCALCTKRANSSLYIDKWKTKISLEFLKIIQNRCKNIMQYYNYNLVTL